MVGAWSKKDDPDLLAELALEAISKRAVIAVVWKATSILVRVVVNSCSRRCHLVIRRDHVLDKLFRSSSWKSGYWMEAVTLLAIDGMDPWYR